MIKALKYEWIRLTTIRSTWVCLGLALILTIIGTIISTLVSINQAQQTKDFVIDPAGAISASSGPVSLLLAFIGIYSFGHEYSHGTIKLTLTAFTKRWQILAAKMAIIGGVSVFVSLFLFLLSVSIFMAVELFKQVPLSSVEIDLIVLILRSTLSASLFAIFGLLIVGTIRNINVTIIVLMTGGLVEAITTGLLGTLHLQKIADYFPVRSMDIFQQTGDWVSGLVFLGYLVVLILVCNYLLKHRDVAN